MAGEEGSRHDGPRSRGLSMGELNEDQLPRSPLSKPIRATIESISGDRVEEDFREQYERL